MAEVKGKFITLAVNLMSIYPLAKETVAKALKAVVGKEWNELDQEGWYDTKIFNDVMTAYANASLTKEQAIVTLGRKIYPTIKASVGLPASLKTPLDFIKFEAEGFLANHRGDGVIPRKFVQADDKHVVVAAPAPGYNEKLYEGVFLGILEMCGIKTGKVVNIGNSTFDITW